MQQASAAPELELGFYLLGDIPAAVELEKLFKVQSVVNFRSGEPRIHATTGLQRGTHWETVWGFSTRHIKSNEMQDHVDWLLATAAPARNLLASGAKASAFIEVALAEGCSTVLSRQLLLFADELNAEIGFVARRGHAA